MNDTVKTVVFAGVGSLLVVGAVIVHFASQPASIEQFALVGEEFYPEFDSPNDATYLEISAFDFEKRKQRSFRVEYKDDKWRIPSHFDYPAEAADRLARTAASVMGIRRQALAGRRANEHKRFGVVDPNSEEAEKVNKNDQEAVGIRVTLGAQTDDVLADYIIGLEVDEQGDLEDEQLREIRGLDASVPLHYVRRPDEDETYVAAINVDASTRFEDWIEPDLLLMDARALLELVVNDYSFETRIEEVEVVPNSGLFQNVRRLEEVAGDAYRLIKESEFGPWTMDGIDAETEEIETSKITQLTSALDEFRIRGVRPRVKIDGYSIITPELKLEFPESIRTENQAIEAIERVARDLESKGFNLRQNPQDRSFAIASDRGELTAATNDGVVYHLYFGDTVVGDESEIEVGVSDGSESDSETDAQDEAGDDAADASSDPAVEGETDALDDDESKNRYLLVRVTFDPSYLGERPTPPVEPTPPAAPGVGAEPGPMPGDGDGDGIDDAAGDGAGDGNGDSDGDGTTPPDDGCNPLQDPDPQDDRNQQTGDPQSGDGAGEQTGQDATGQDQDTAGPDTAGPDTAGPDTAGPDTAGPDTAGQDVGRPAGTDAANQDDPPLSPPDPQQDYRLAMIRYQAAMAQYEQDLADYERRVRDGQSKVDQLNARFADWYYLIPADRLDTLRLSRTDLVRAKEVETPPIDPIQIPSLDPGNTDNGGADAGNVDADDTTGDSTTGGDGTAGDGTSGDDTAGDDNGGGDSNSGDSSGGDTSGGDNSGN